MDIFETLGITDEFGNELSETTLNPLLGYKIVHKVTGKLMPHTQDHEIMGIDYANKRLKVIREFYKMNNLFEPLDDYIFEPIYFSEIEDGNVTFILLYSEKDKKEFGLFN